MKASNPASDYLDNRIHALSITPLQKRAGLSREQFQAYWKDVHGPVCARLPHLGLYVQHHLQPNDADLFPPVPGVDRQATPENRWDGFAEIGFLSSDDLDRWLPTTPILFSDEQNVFASTVAYYCDDSSETLSDTQASLVTNGSTRSPFIYLFIQKQPDVAVEDAARFLREEVLAALVSNEHVERVRYHVLAEHDNSVPNPPAPNVSHHLDLSDQHQFVVELAVDSVLGWKQALHSDDVQRVLGKLATFFRAVHPYATAGRYTFCYDGRITLAGLRGSTAARVIKDVGAVNQVREDVESLMLTGSL